MKYDFHEVPTCNMCASERRKIMGRRMNTSQGLRPKSKIGISTTIVKCLDCGLVYADPLPVPETIEQHYGVPPESYWRPEYFEVPRDYFYPQFQRMTTLSGGRSFLDIGAGIGKCVKSAIDFGLDAYGLEPSKEFYERSELNGRMKNVSVEDVSFDRTFDMISFGGVLEHLYDPAAMLEKALGWLNPKGVIYVDVPNSNYLLSKIFNAYFRLCLTDYVVNVSPMHNPFHLYEFTEKSFEENGERLGYKIASAHRYAGSLFRYDKFLRPVMDRTKTGLGIIMYLQKH